MIDRRVGNGRAEIAVEPTPAAPPDAVVSLGFRLISAFLLPALVVLAGAVGFLSTLEVSTYKLVMVVLGMIMLPILLIHLELSTISLLGVLWARISDVAIKFHGFPSIATPLAALIVTTSIFRKLARGERIGAATFRDLYPIAPYVFIVLVSATWASHPDRALSAAFVLVKDILIFWMLADALRSSQSIKHAARVLVLTTGALAVVGLHQQLTGNFDSSYGGLAQSQIQNIVGDLDDSRLGGTLGDPNYFALVLVLAVPLALALLRTRTSLLERALTVGFLGAIMLATMFTYSRGGLLLLSFALLLSLPRYRLKLPQIIGVVLITSLVVVAASSRVWDRIETLVLPLTGGGEAGALVDSSVELRLGAQATALEMFLSSPFIGVGAGNYAPLYQDYSRWLGLRSIGSEFAPHNLYLEILAETGVIGLIAYAFLALAPLLALRRQRSRMQAAESDPDGRGELSYGVETAYVCYLVAGFLLHGAFARYFWILLALVVVAARSAHTQIDELASDEPEDARRLDLSQALPQGLECLSLA